MSPEPPNPTDTPPFLDTLGDQLTEGRAHLISRRRRRRYLLTAAVPLVVGVVLVAAVLGGRGSTDQDVATDREVATGDVDPPADGDPPPADETDGGAELDRYRCSVVTARSSRPVTGPLSTDPDLARYQQLRADAGLPSDLERTEAALADNALPLDPAATTDEGADYPLHLGFPVTDAEYLLLVGNDEGHASISWPVIEDEAGAEALAAFVATLDPERYGGRWTDVTRLGRPLTIGVVADDGEDTVAEVQAQLDDRFGPGVVAAAAAPRSAVELEAIGDRASEVLRRLGTDGWYLSTDHQLGVVEVGLPVFSPEVVGALVAELGPDGWCGEGPSADEVPAPGPSRASGEGWRLLADLPETGSAYRTWVAVDQAGYDTLARHLAWSEQPAVDFSTEVVVWFGAVHGSSCPDIRLDDVVLLDEPAQVSAQIGYDGPQPPVCTADAIPRAFVVAVARDALPPAPFFVGVVDAQDSAYQITIVTEGVLDGSEPLPPIG